MVQSIKRVNRIGEKVDKYKRVNEYIKNSWLLAVKKKDVDKDFLLPYDYVPPCVDGDLINLYYWDTYFTNKGLFLDGLKEYAFGNVENLKYCLRKFGCVPNMCRVNGAKYTSQPPLLYLMIKDCYDVGGDKALLKDGYDALKTEYKFWMEKRLVDNGLNRYGTNDENATDDQVLEVFEYYITRSGRDFSKYTREELVRFIKRRQGEGESGEDHTPRFLDKAMEICPIDLNCYLFGFEKTMAEFSGILKLGEERSWEERAEKRAKLINEFCLDRKSGVLFDYDYVEKTRTGIYAAACYLPFVFGLCSDKKAIEKINRKLKFRHGVSSCEKFPTDGASYQWGYPNSWAPHNFWAAKANEKVGNEKAAKSIMQNYLETVADEFSLSGKLFEKYDAVVGGKATVNEYGLPEMLGWTAGVYQYFYSLIKEYE